MLTDEVKASLRTTEFDMMQYEPSELIELWKYMFADLGFVEAFSLDSDALHGFLLALTRNYNEVPFHNIWHCFCVTQMMYCLLVSLRDMHPFLTMLEQFAVFVAACCHDVDHTGLNNAYQINAMTPLALIYNDSSCLENHHCSSGFAILLSDESNIIRYLSPAQAKDLRRIFIKAVLATDLANHFRIKSEFEAVVSSGFHFDDANHRLLLCEILLMCCDISNELRPERIAVEWAERLALEFSLQVDLERSAGLPVAPFMDPEQTSIASSQSGFISSLLLPLWLELARLFPQLAPYVAKIRHNLEFWKHQAHMPSGAKPMDSAK